MKVLYVMNIVTQENLKLHEFFFSIKKLMKDINACALYAQSLLNSFTARFGCNECTNKKYIV